MSSRPLWNDGGLPAFDPGGREDQRKQLNKRKRFIPECSLGGRKASRPTWRWKRVVWYLGGCSDVGDKGCLAVLLPPAHLQEQEETLVLVLDHLPEGPPRLRWRKLLLLGDTGCICRRDRALFLATLQRPAQHLPDAAVRVI